MRALGFKQLRVRYHDAIARLEIDVEDLPRMIVPDVREQVNALGKRLGFRFVTLDLGGCRSGSLDEAPLLSIGRRASAESDVA